MCYINIRKGKPKGQLTMDNPEALATLGTRDTGQSRGTGNIGHTGHRTKTNKAQKHNTENVKDEQHGPHQTPEVNPGAREG